MRMPFEKLMEHVAAISEDERALPLGVFAERWHEPAERIMDAIDAVRVLNGERTYVPLDLTRAPCPQPPAPGMHNIGMAARQRYQAQAQAIRSDAPQRECGRGLHCAARTRDPEGTWHAARVAQPLCPADREVMISHLGELPACYERLAAMAVSPVKSGLAIRIPPASRVHVNPEADALMRLIADTAGAWAARVRAVPQLSLSWHGHPHGSAEQVAADCGTLAVHPDPLLALPAGPMTRTWTWAPGREWTDPGPPSPVPCRRCGMPLTPAPSGNHWWPAACTHPLADPVTKGEDEEKRIIAWRCRTCATRLLATWQPGTARCRHHPLAGPRTAPAAGMPAETEQEIADLEVVRIGYGWVTALTSLDGEDAALEIFDVRCSAVLLLREDPAPPDLLDGIPCRACEAMSSLEVVPAPPPDPEKPPPPFSRCRMGGCRDEMTRKEYEDWVRQYREWARGAGIITCRRCDLGKCVDCQWDSCGCRASGHAAALFAKAATGVQH